MTKCQIFGYIHSMTGPSMHARNFVKALARNGLDVSVKTLFQYSPNWVLEPEVFACFEKPLYEDAPRVLMEDPMTWWHHLVDKKTPLIGVMIFEGTCIPYGWAEVAAQPEIDEIWTCSNHSRESILEGFKTHGFSVSPDKVKIIPHGFDPEVFHPPGRKMKVGQFDDYFTFLYVGGWSQGVRDRKGLDLLYRAFCEEFKSDEKVRLVAKVTKIYNQPGYDVMNELQKLHDAKGSAPCLLLMEDFPNPDDLASVYRMADVFVMPTKADGFNIPGLEALACGIPVLANNYGGQLDYLSPDNAWFLTEGKMEWATDANRPLYDWAKWKVPDVEELKRVMRMLVNDKGQVLAKRAIASDSVKEWTWDRSAKMAIERLNSLVTQ